MSQVVAAKLGHYGGEEDDSEDSNLSVSQIVISSEDEQAVVNDWISRKPASLPHETRAPGQHPQGAASVPAVVTGQGTLAAQSYLDPGAQDRILRSAKSSGGRYRWVQAGPGLARAQSDTSTFTSGGAVAEADRDVGREVTSAQRGDVGYEVTSAQREEYGTGLPSPGDPSGAGAVGTTHGHGRESVKHPGGAGVWPLRGRGEGEVASSRRGALGEDSRQGAGGPTQYQEGGGDVPLLDAVQPNPQLSVQVKLGSSLTRPLEVEIETNPFLSPKKQGGWGTGFLASSLSHTPSPTDQRRAVGRDISQADELASQTQELGERVAERLAGWAGGDLEHKWRGEGDVSRAPGEREGSWEPARRDQNWGPAQQDQGRSPVWEDQNRGPPLKDQNWPSAQRGQNWGSAQKGHNWGSPVEIPLPPFQPHPSPGHRPQDSERLDLEWARQSRDDDELEAEGSTARAPGLGKGEAQFAGGGARDKGGEVGEEEGGQAVERRHSAEGTKKEKRRWALQAGLQDLRLSLQLPRKSTPAAAAAPQPAASSGSRAAHLSFVEAGSSRQLDPRLKRGGSHSGVLESAPREFIISPPRSDGDLSEGAVAYRKHLDYLSDELRGAARRNAELEQSLHEAQKELDRLHAKKSKKKKGAFAGMFGRVSGSPMDLSGSNRSPRSSAAAWNGTRSPRAPVSPRDGRLVEQLELVNTLSEQNAKLLSQLKAAKSRIADLTDMINQQPSPSPGGQKSPVTAVLAAAAAKAFSSGRRSVSGPLTSEVDPQLLQDIQTLKSRAADLEQSASRLREENTALRARVLGMERYGATTEAGRAEMERVAREKQELQWQFAGERYLPPESASFLALKESEVRGLQVHVSDLESQVAGFREETKGLRAEAEGLRASLRAAQGRERELQEEGRSPAGARSIDSRQMQTLSARISELEAYTKELERKLEQKHLQEAKLLLATTAAAAGRGGAREGRRQQLQQQQLGGGSSPPMSPTVAPVEASPELNPYHEGFFSEQSLVRPSDFEMCAQRAMNAVSIYTTRIISSLKKLGLPGIDPGAIRGGEDKMASIARMGSALEPGALFLRPQHAKYAIEGVISGELFRHFENESFELGGACGTAPRGERSHRFGDLFRALIGRRGKDGGDDSAIGAEGERSALHLGNVGFLSPRFKDYYQRCLRGIVTRVRSAVPELSQGTAVALVVDATMELEDAYMAAVRAAWTLHTVAFAFEPPAEIVRGEAGMTVTAGSGCFEICNACLEDAGGVGEDAPIASAFVREIEFVVRPGFRLGNIGAYKCTVYLRAKERLVAGQHPIYTHGPTKHVSSVRSHVY